MANTTMTPVEKAETASEAAKAAIKQGEEIVSGIKKLDLEGKTLEERDAAIAAVIAAAMN